MFSDIEFYTDKVFEGIIPEPIPAYKLFPEWFSNMKRVSKCPFRFNPDDSLSITIDNVKNCPGITDFLKMGYIVPAWDTFTFRRVGDNDIRIDWMNTNSGTHYVGHPDDQFPTMPKDKKPNFNSFFKLVSPWMVRTRPGISIMYTTPWWHRNKIFTTCAGVQHTDVASSEVSWMFELNNNKDFKKDDMRSLDMDKQIVYEGEPVAVIIPFYRDQFKSEISYVDNVEYRRQRNIAYKSSVISKMKNRGLSDYQKARRFFKNTFR
tara:strand:- start:94 stop:882 length:789 start_codon:yes stop_codon:yes gene_type:complete